MENADLEYMERYGHLRANVPLRRTAYGWFLIVALVVFVVSIVDIVYLDQVLMWGVVGAYGVVLIWGIILLFSRRVKGEKLMEFEIADAMHLEEEYLRCPECRHVFEFEMEHRDQSHDVNFTCPECAYIGRLPPVDREPVAAPVPGGGGHGPTFLCGKCGEHWKVGALGHSPKEDVRFSACPHCGETEDFSLLQDDDPATPY